MRTVVPIIVLPSCVELPLTTCGSGFFGGLRKPANRSLRISSNPNGAWRGETRPELELSLARVAARVDGRGAPTRPSAGDAARAAIGLIANRRRPLARRCFRINPFAGRQVAGQDLAQLCNLKSWSRYASPEPLRARASLSALPRTDPPR